MQIKPTEESLEIIHIKHEVMNQNACYHILNIRRDIKRLLKPDNRLLSNEDDRFTSVH